MKIALDWLNQSLDRPTDAVEAQRVLTEIGLAVEHVTQAAGDTLLEVEVTSNRPDCLSHIGVARELAAATGRSLRMPETATAESAIPVESLTSVANHEHGLCPLYTARVITGVKVRPSPAWLVRRLESIGLRPVNNVVDITNFVLHETGQPLHAFDMANLAGRRIVVRKATSGEPFTAIDGTKHKLRPDMLVIADAQKAQAVAGVMGGLHSEVGDSTTDVLIESARFDPLNIRTTGRALKLASDSSFRFERGVDPNGVDFASRRAARLILELAGGSIARGVIAEGGPQPQPTTVSMRTDRCRALLGIEIADDRMMQLLAALGLQPHMEGGTIRCTIPSHRLDLKHETDLIEEVTRLHGYGQIPVEPRMHIVALRPQAHVLARRAVSNLLVAHGYHEAVTFSFLPPQLAEPFLPTGASLVSVDEEKKKAEPAIRPSLLPSLLACRKSNQDAGNPLVSLFEIAHSYATIGGRYVESRRLALLTDADDITHSMRRVRGTFEELLAEVGLAKTTRILPGKPTPWADTVAEVRCGDDVVGRYGPASHAIRKRFDLQTSVILAEIDFDALLAAYPPRADASPPPRFPAIERDLSLILDESTPYADAQRILDALHLPLLEAVQFVTAYRGKPIPAGRKSITLRLTFRDPQRTLRHEEVSGAMDALIAAMTTQLNAEVRTI